MSKNKKKDYRDMLGGINIDQALQDPPRGRTTSGRGSDVEIRKTEQRKQMQAPMVQIDFSNLQHAIGDAEIPVQFPHNYFRPLGAESVDIRRLRNVVDGEDNLQILSFTAPKSAGVFFTGYGVFTDILLAENVLFVPRINGRRVLRYHGDPNENFKIDLSISADLGNDAIIPCELYLNPGQTITWSVTNNSGASGPMGIRMTGYVDTKTKRSYTNFGG